MLGILIYIDNLNLLKEKNLFRKLKITLDIDSINMKSFRHGIYIP